MLEKEANESGQYNFGGFATFNISLDDIEYDVLRFVWAAIITRIILLIIDYFNCMKFGFDVSHRHIYCGQLTWIQNNSTKTARDSLTHRNYY